MLDTTVSWIQIFRCRFKGSWRLHRHHLWWWFFPTQTIIKLKDSGTSVICNICFQFWAMFFFFKSYRTQVLVIHVVKLFSLWWMPSVVVVTSKPKACWVCLLCCRKIKVVSMLPWRWPKEWTLCDLAGWSRHVTWRFRDLRVDSWSLEADGIIISSSRIMSTLTYSTSAYHSIWNHFISFATCHVIIIPFIMSFCLFE